MIVSMWATAHSWGYPIADTAASINEAFGSTAVVSKASTSSAVSVQLLLRVKKLNSSRRTLFSMIDQPCTGVKIRIHPPRACSMHREQVSTG